MRVRTGKLHGCSPTSNGDVPRMIQQASDLVSPLQGTSFVNSAFLSPEDRQALAKITTIPRTLRAGVNFISEGERTESVYIITEGWACRHKATREGGRQVTKFAIPGDRCNLDSFLLSEVNFGVRTLTAATVVGLPRDRVQALAAKRPGVARAFTWLAIMENAVLSEWLFSLGRKSARARFAHFLCEMSIRLGGQDENQASFDLPISQEQISDVIGMTAVHANRIMQQLRSERLIDYEGRHFIILDTVALHRAGEFDGSYLHAAPSPDTRSLAGNC